MIISPIDKTQENHDIQSILNSEYQNIVTKKARANYEIKGNSELAKDRGPLDITKVDWNNLTFEDFCAVERRLHMNGQYLKSQKTPIPYKTLNSESLIKRQEKQKKQEEERKKREENKIKKIKKIQLNGFIYELSNEYYTEYMEITDIKYKIEYLKLHAKAKTEVFEL